MFLIFFKFVFENIHENIIPHPHTYSKRACISINISQVLINPLSSYIWFGPATVIVLFLIITIYHLLSDFKQANI